MSVSWPSSAAFGLQQGALVKLLPHLYVLWFSIQVPFKKDFVLLHYFAGANTPPPCPYYCSPRCQDTLD